MTRTEKNDEIQKNIEEEELKKEKKRKRKKILKIILLILLIITSFLLYSRFISTSFLEVREYKITKENIPSSFNGFKIIQFSDLHYGSTINEKSLKSIIKKINELKPDLVVFTGDLISDEVSLTDVEINTLTNLLSTINSTTGKYAISGNHDDITLYSSILLGSGFKYLDNNSDLIYYKDDLPILLTGIGSSIQNNNNITTAFDYFNDNNSNKDIYTISIFHEPDQITDIVNTKSVDLALAGHSHNGQIRFPFIGAIIRINGAKTYINKQYNVNSTDLFISGGLGTSIINYRLFDHPSINLFRLYTK